MNSLLRHFPAVAGVRRARWHWPHRHHLHAGVTTPVQVISKLPTDLSARDIDAMARIVANYMPDAQVIDRVVRDHLRHADSVCLALHDGVIVGFSIASRQRMRTPFHARPIDVIYQRMLDLEPAFIFHGIGKKLLAATLSDLLGPLWLVKRVVLICRTQNPIVARYMQMFSRTYPQYGQAIPPAVRRFAEQLLPLLGAIAVDERFRLEGTLSSFTGVDFTAIWNRYLHRRNSDCERLMLQTAYREIDGRVVNRGVFVLMIGYAKPLRFLACHLRRRSCSAFADLRRRRRSA